MYFGNLKGYLAPLSKEAETSLWHYLKEWFCSTDAKRIGVMYIVLAIMGGLIGLIESLVIRAELIAPGQTVVTPETYMTLPGMHATAMIFFFIIPLFTGFGNFVVPVQIGAPDMAFPKLNLCAFWILPPAVIIVFAFVLC